MLPLLHNHFTGYYTCSALILPDIALAADKFYQMLPLPHHHCTEYWTCSAPILLDIAVAAVDISLELNTIGNRISLYC
jgi:hypothetical protein